MHDPKVRVSALCISSTVITSFSFAHEDDVITVRRVYYVPEIVITASECAKLKHAARLNVCSKRFIADRVTPIASHVPSCNR